MMLWAVLQLAAPTVAATADAQATAASAEAHAHVEARSGADCIRVHDTECVFCQLLSTCLPEYCDASDRSPKVVNIGLMSP